jgi:hypothetical protein
MIQFAQSLNERLDKIERRLSGDEFWSFITTYIARNFSRGKTSRGKQDIRDDTTMIRIIAGRKKENDAQRMF